MSVGAFFLIFFAVLFFGLPIAGCFGFMTILPNLVSDSFPVDAMMAVRTMANGLNSFTLLAIPLFVLAGIIMARGGISEKLFNFLHILLEIKQRDIPVRWLRPAYFTVRSPARRPRPQRRLVA